MRPCHHAPCDPLYIPFDRPDPDVSHGYRRIPGRVTGPDGRPLFRIDGPFSAPTQHLAESPVSLVIGAGIGSTVLSACLRQVVHHDWKRNVGVSNPGRAYFVWMVPHADIHSYRWLIKLIRETRDKVQHMAAVGLMQHKTFELHVYVTSVPGQAERTKAATALLAEVEAGGNEHVGCSGRCGGGGSGSSSATSPRLSRAQSFVSLLPASPRGWEGAGKGGEGGGVVTPKTGELTAADYELALQMIDPPLSAKTAAAKWPVRVPGVEEVEAGEVGGGKGEGPVWVYSGRPDWGNMLQSLAFAHGGEASAGVMFCGPPNVGSDLRKECWKRNVAMRKTHFKMFSENF